jgi:probable F420-dependent oxidoreductase
MTSSAYRLERRLNFGNAHDEASRGALERVMTEPDWSSIPGQVVEAEALGYDTLLSAEIPNDPLFPLVLASQTPSRLVLGTGIAVALTRSPVAMAYSAWELQRMSGGRFMLGVGSQVKAHITRRFSMPWSSPAERMKEYIQVLKACWSTWQTGAPLDFQGEVYQVTLMPPGMQLPPQANPHIPVQLAAVGEMMLRVAGEVADGVRLHDFASRRYVHEVALPNLKAGFERSGRPQADWNGFQVAGGGMIATAETPDELAAEVLELRKRLAFYASTPAYKVQMEIEGWGDEAEALTKMSKEGRWDDMLSVFTEEMAHRYAAIGTHDVIVDRVRAHFDKATAIQFSMRLRDDRDRGILKELLADLKS